MSRSSPHPDLEARVHYIGLGLLIRGHRNPEILKISVQNFRNFEQNLVEFEQILPKFMKKLKNFGQNNIVSGVTENFGLKFPTLVAIGETERRVWVRGNRVLLS